jgi:hypothetical protein
MIDPAPLLSHERGDRRPDHRSRAPGVEGRKLIPVELFARYRQAKGVVSKRREREQLLAQFTPGS